jgi:hypothetical protein
MRNLGQILLLLFFIALPLLNFLLQRARKRRHQPIPQEKSVEQMFYQAQTTLPRPTPRAAGDPVHGSPARIVTPLANDEITKRSPLGTTRDVRRAIVIMTLMGPCRAFDRGDSRGSGRSS